MRSAKFSEKRLRVAEGFFVLAFLPSLFIGMFILVPGFEIKARPWHHWTFAVSLSVLGVSGLFMIARKLRKDRYPDILAFYPGMPFEGAGIQVIPVRSPAVASPGGPLRIGIFFQNRFDAQSRLVVRLRYPSGTVAVDRTLDVAPGEAGFAWQTIALPGSLPVGRAPLKLELEGTRGAGPEVRFTEGRIVRSDASKALEVIAMAMSAHHFHLGANQDVLPLEIAADAPQVTHSGDPEGLLRLWVRGMPPLQTKSAMDQAMSLLAPR